MADIRPVLNPKTHKQLRDDDGNSLYKFNATGASRALELIGKHVDIGAFQDRVEVSGERDLVARINAARAHSRQVRVNDGKTEDVKPAALSQLRPGAASIEIELEPAKVEPKRIEGNPKVAEASVATRTSERAERGGKTGLPAGLWRDPLGLIRGSDGRVAVRAHREQESRADAVLKE